MLSFNEYIRQPHVFFISLLREFGSLIPDRLYLRMLYYLRTGKRLNLHHPKTFGEKIQWLKLYDRKPEYTMMVDKYAVKDYVAGLIGWEYVIPTIGVWDYPEDVDFDSLPQQFVLKTTHGGGSGGVIICKDKRTLDKEDAIQKLQIAMKKDIYRNLREWPYKDVRRRIIAEQYLEDLRIEDGDMIDYKFYCFGGTPAFCQVIGGRRKKETIDFFDMNWQHQEFYGLNPIARPSAKTPMKPLHFKEMQNIACILSQNLIFCRIDLYDTLDRLYFGEITLYPASGIGSFKPLQYNNILGEMIKLPYKWKA